MEQHPIPQQISSYEFKLVGDMTLKQFLKAAAGIVIAVIIYSSNLIFFSKVPVNGSIRSRRFDDRICTLSGSAPRNLDIGFFEVDL